MAYKTKIINVSVYLKFHNYYTILSDELKTISLKY